jgi:hypothetical protein
MTKFREDTTKTLRNFSKIALFILFGEKSASQTVSGRELLRALYVCDSFTNWANPLLSARLLRICEYRALMSEPKTQWDKVKNDNTDPHPARQAC